MLTDRLVQDKIKYTWAIPFNLLVEYKAQRIIIRQAEEATFFLECLDKEVVDTAQQAECRLLEGNTGADTNKLCVNILVVYLLQTKFREYNLFLQACSIAYQYVVNREIK